MPELAELDVGPAEARGPDVLHQIAVEPELTRRGVRLLCQLPRRLRCALCEGGGCDRCERRGALTLHSGSAADTVEVSLPVSELPVRVRIPERGAPGRDGETRGCLVLTVVAGPTDAGVTVLTPKAPRLLLLPWLVLLVVLSFAGWALGVWR